MSSKIKINLVNELVDYTVNEAQRFPEQTLEDLVINGTVLEVMWSGQNSCTREAAEPPLDMHLHTCASCAAPPHSETIE